MDHNIRKFKLNFISVIIYTHVSMYIFVGKCGNLNHAYIYVSVFLVFMIFSKYYKYFRKLYLKIEK